MIAQHLHKDTVRKVLGEPLTQRLQRNEGRSESHDAVYAKDSDHAGSRSTPSRRARIQTDFSGGMARDNPEAARHIAEVTALGRPELPDDTGPMIASLLSEDNRWINAQRIEVSGGQAI